MRRSPACADGFGNGDYGASGSTYELRIPLTAVRFSYRAFARDRNPTGTQGLYAQGNSEYEVIVGTSGALPFKSVKITSEATNKPIKVHSDGSVQTSGFPSKPDPQFETWKVKKV